MAYSIDVLVLAMVPDSDPMGNEYVAVHFGYKLPVPLPPQNIYPPPPKPNWQKYALSLFIPKDKWFGQFNIFEECHLVIADDGTVTLKKKE